MILSLMHILSGYLVLTINGAYIERFLNLCVRNKIYMWGIRKAPDGSTRLSVSIRGFRRMRHAAQTTHTRVHIAEKRGLPLFFHRHRRRKAFLVGIIVFILILVFLTSFIWDIQIEDTEKIDKNIIRNALKSCGLDEGVIKYKIKPSKIKSAMLQQVPELSWLFVEIRGTRAYVHVRERTPSPEIVEDHIPANIVAAKDGVIEDIVSTNGQGIAMVGDVVKKGDLLISGTVQTKHGGTRLVHAMGTVTAKTWYEQSGTFPLWREEKHKTGHVKKRYSLTFGEKVLPLYFSKSIPFDTYDSEIKTTPLRLFGDFYLPVSFSAETVTEHYVEREKMSVAEAAAYYGEQLISKMNLPSEIVKKEITHILQENGTIFVTATVECREEIGKATEILEGTKLDREIF